MKFKTLNGLYSFLICSILILNTIARVYAQSGSSDARYQIQPGDTLISIATEFGISVDSLIQTNNISDPDSISPGQIIVIPGLSGITGVIAPLVLDLGNSLQSVTSQYSLNSKDFINLNHITSIEELNAGLKVLIPIPDEFELPKTVSIDTNLSLLETALLLNTSPEIIVTLNDQATLLLPDELITLPKDTNESLFFNKLARNSVSVSPLPLVQGSTATIWVSSKTAIKVSGSLNEYDLQFHSDSPGRFFALQGIHAMANVGLSELVLSIQDSNGSSQQVNYKALIFANNFPIDAPIIVDPKTLDPQITKPEIDFIDELVSNQTDIKLWTGQFQSPAFYQEYTSLFGSRRTYNDDPQITFHGGLDFGGGETLPIVAPADGKVVFSGFLPIRGNVTFLDHGLGVYTGYFHQSKLLVSVGDFVEKGQKIGEVGNTGRVGNANDYQGAGAHLHWEIWVNGVQVDPLDWLDNEYP